MIKVTQLPKADVHTLQSSTEIRLMEKIVKKLCSWRLHHTVYPCPFSRWNTSAADSSLSVASTPIRSMLDLILSENQSVLCRAK
jgi:hypothetical protein